MTLSLEQGILLFIRRGGGDELAGGQSVWPGQFSFEVICEVGLSTDDAGLQTAKKHHRLTVLGRQLNVSNFWPIQEIYGTQCYICFRVLCLREFFFCYLKDSVDCSFFLFLTLTGVS